MNFKVGERVAIHDKGKRASGTIININTNVQVELDRFHPHFATKDWYSPQQCRRLVKAKRRRIWLTRRNLNIIVSNPGLEVFTNVSSVNNGGIEFVEVRRKK